MVINIARINIFTIIRNSIHNALVTALVTVLVATVAANVITVMRVYDVLPIRPVDGVVVVFVARRYSGARDELSNHTAEKVVQIVVTAGIITIVVPIIVQIIVTAGIITIAVSIVVQLVVAAGIITFAVSIVVQIVVIAGTITIAVSTS